MAECSKCGKETMSFTCRYCGEKFCSEHRLPENHDCEGLESGKKEEYSSSSGNKDEKWFDDRFSNRKEDTRTSKEFQRPGFLNESARILKSNITLIIIGLTAFTYMLHETLPVVKDFLTLSPALTDAAVQATNQAVAEYSNSTGRSLPTPFIDKTVLEAPWTLATVMLVHANFFHFLANMATFYFFGTAVEKAVGGVKMLKMYILSGLAASIAVVAFRNLLFQLYGPLHGSVALSPIVGASGAVVAMLGIVAMLYPDAEVLLYFFIPMKIRTAVYLFGGMETFNLFAKILGVHLPLIGGFASSAHLAGLAAGLYYGKKLQGSYSRRTAAFDPLGY
ncbi:MAG: rhomboid family intramembrane serine protease [Candidatus Nanohalobium sp.]